MKNANAGFSGVVKVPNYRSFKSHDDYDEADEQEHFYLAISEKEIMEALN